MHALIHLQKKKSEKEKRKEKKVSSFNSHVNKISLKKGGTMKSLLVRL